MHIVKLIISSACVTVFQAIPFPSPSYISDWKLIKAQSTNESEVVFTHGLNVLPYKVLVEVMVNSNGSNYIFHGIGSAHIDDDRPFVYGGVIYLYNETIVKCLTPNAANGHGIGVTIYTGKTGWSGPSYINRSFHEAFVRVKVWAPQDFVTPDFLHNWTSISVFDSTCYKEVRHTLADFPDFVVIQVRGLGTFISEAQGSTSLLNNIKRWTNFGGVVYGFSNESFRLWYPCITSAYHTSVKGGIMNFADGWGKGYGYAETGEYRILAWRTLDNWCVESRILDSKEVKIIADLNSSYVNVEAEAIDGANDGFRFYGVGSTVNDGGIGEYGGLIYAYNEQKVLYWVPSLNSSGHVINIGGVWGSEKNAQASDDMKIRIRVFSMPTNVSFCRVAEAESYTFDVNELILDRQSTSAFKRSKISVYEGSASVVAMGSLGLVLIVSTLLILTVPGIPTVLKHIKIGYRNLRQFDRVNLLNILKIRL